MRSSDRTRCALVLALLLAGCGPGLDDDDTPFDCTLGVWHEDGTWQAADGADAELIFGFQGFLWISVQLQAESSGPDTTNLRWSATLDGEDPFGGSQPSIPLPARDGARFSDELQIRLSNDEGPDPYVGRSLELAARATSGARECTTSATLTLRDDDPCIHTDDEPLCDDDDSAS